MSHLVPRFMMLEAGVTAEDLASHRFLGSHDNVALGVLAGDFDVGAVKEEVFYKYRDQGLVALATTPSLSEHCFVTRKDLPDTVVRPLRAALFRLHETQEGHAIMASIKTDITAFVPVQDHDYDNLRDILTTLQTAGIQW
jgi:phosphonate transport system substrate-binding protein